MLYIENSRQQDLADDSEDMNGYYFISLFLIVVIVLLLLLIFNLGHQTAKHLKFSLFLIILYVMFGRMSMFAKKCSR